MQAAHIAPPGTFPKEIRQLMKARFIFSVLVENELGKVS
jgi:hypothetical protein